MTASHWVRAIAALAGGTAAGAVFFVLLRVTVDLYGSRRWPLGIAMHLARWALLASVLVAAAHAGATPLMMAGGGALIARGWVVRRVHEPLA